MVGLGKYRGLSILTGFLALLCNVSHCNPSWAAIRGDVNNDGIVDHKDSIQVLEIITSKHPEVPTSVTADVDGDGMVGLAESIFALQAASGQQGSFRAWFEDQPVIPTPTRVFTIPYAAITGFPRKSSSTVLQDLSADAFSTCDLISAKLSRAATIAAAQKIRMTTWARIFSGIAYQGFTDTKPGSIKNGHNFDASGPISENGVVWPGHWLYLGGTTTATAITSTSTNVSVASLSGITVGSYVVIYNAPFGSFDNAEHCQVNSISYNSTTSLYDLEITRGYKSTAVSHPQGSCIAQHAQGNAPDARLWRYNLSTVCPIDGAGKKCNQFLAEWIAKYYDMESYSTKCAGTVHGIVFDSDFGIDSLGSLTGDPWDDRAIDTNCDGTKDFGLISGVNQWALGLNEFFTMIRAELDNRGRTNVFLQGGESNTPGHGLLSGVQMEAAYSGQMDEEGNANEKVENVPRYISVIQSHQSTCTVQPMMDEVMEKIATVAYPCKASAEKGIPVSNRFARFSIGMSCIQGTLVGFHNWEPADADRHYDEMAVDLTPGANYGKAVPKTDFAGRRAHGHWLGAPLANYRRVYSYEDTAPENAIFSSGFESSTPKWNGTNVALSQTTAEKLAGSGSLKGVISSTLIDWPADKAARIKGPSVTLTGGREYSLCFAVKANRHGRVRPSIGGVTANGIYVAPGQWSRRVFTFRADSNWTGNIQFDVGSFGGGDIFFDEIYLFSENVDVFIREFENGIVVANATPTAKTVDLGGTFQRIIGTGQDVINDGSSMSSVTVGPWDSAILVRPQ